MRHDAYKNTNLFVWLKAKIKNSGEEHAYKNTNLFVWLKAKIKNTDVKYVYTLCHINQVSIYGTFLICQFLAIWLSNTILHHKVNGTCTCFIFSFCNLNEWIHPWLSIQRFIIMWSPFLFLMRPRVVYFALLNLPLKYQFSVYI